jgi:hypothetical protein
MIPLASYAPITGDYWYPVLSAAFKAVWWLHPLVHWIPINHLMICAQDTKNPAMNFPYT